jgi:hypothetical protein
MIGLTVLVAITGGAILAAVAAARRTESAFDRFERAVHEGSLVVSGFVGGPPLDLDVSLLDQAARVDGVIEASAYSAMGVAAAGHANFFSIASIATHGQPGKRVLADGRQPRPSAVDEVMVNEAMRDELRARVGDRVELLSLTPAQWQRLGRGEDPGPPAGPSVAVTIVGILRDTEAISDAPDPLFFLPSAFWQTYRGAIGHCDCLVNVYANRAAEESVTEELRDIYGDGPIVEKAEPYHERIQDTIALQRTALLVIAGAAIGAAVVVAILGTSRLASADAADNEIWRALGMRPRQLVVARLLAVTPAVVAGAVIAVGIAYLLSPLAPIGLAGRAEPDPGLRADVAVYISGAALITATALGIAAVTTRRRGDRRRAHPKRPQRVASMFGPVVGFGIRATFRMGRAGVVGVAVGVAGLGAALTLNGSVDHLLATPRLYGADYDAVAEGLPNELEDLREAVVQDADASAVAELWSGANGRGATVAGPTASTEVDPSAIVPVSGSIGPVVVEGRAPVGLDEVAAGRAVLDRLGARVNDVVEVDGGKGPVSLRVVGVTIEANTDVVDEGFSVTRVGLERLVEPVLSAVAVRLADDADPDQVYRRYGVDEAHARPTPPSKVGNIGELGGLPGETGVLLASLGVAALLHSFATTARRCRRDVAIHRTLGFTHGQAIRVLVWQGALTALAGVLIGLPVGWILGRLTFVSLIEGVGAIPETVFPASIWLVASSALALCVTLSVVAGAVVSRSTPVSVLRAE